METHIDKRQINERKLMIHITDPDGGLICIRPATEDFIRSLGWVRPDDNSQL